MIFRPIRTRRAFEEICERIREQLALGVLKPGDKLPPERELAQQLGVSRNVLREALRSLEGEGLVITRPGRSVVIAPLNLDDLHGIYRLRRTLEPVIAVRSCPLLSDQDLDRLEAQASDLAGVDQFRKLIRLLEERGYGEERIAKIMGGNFIAYAERIWG